MIHSFYRTDINLDLYQYQEVPQAIVPYEQRFERSLSTAIKKFQAELNWEEMWNLQDVKLRLVSGWKFWVLRPKNQIRGWIWLTPTGEMKNLYVSKRLRNQGWGKQLYLTAMNEALDLGYSSVFTRVDVWNEPAKACVDNLLRFAGCKSNIKLTIEDY